VVLEVHTCSRRHYWECNHDGSYPLGLGDNSAMEDELLLVVRSLVEFRATCLLLAYNNRGPRPSPTSHHKSNTLNYIYNGWTKHRCSEAQHHRAIIIHAFHEIAEFSHQDNESIIAGYHTPSILEVRGWLKDQFRTLPLGQIDQVSKYSESSELSTLIVRQILQMTCVEDRPEVMYSFSLNGLPAIVSIEARRRQ
jgi:hypothetical protein